MLSFAEIGKYQYRVKFLTWGVIISKSAKVIIPLSYYSKFEDVLKIICILIQF